MANNLKDHLKEVADAIRAKKGTSDLINPQDFATEIEGISGSGEGEGSNIEYLDVSGIENDMLVILLTGIGVNVKWDSLGNTDHHSIVIAPTGVVGLPRKEDGYTPDANILAVAVDKTIVLYDRLFGETPISVGDFLEANSIDLASIPRLTKEQFYSLE